MWKMLEDDTLETRVSLWQRGPGTIIRYRDPARTGTINPLCRSNS